MSTFAARFTHGGAEYIVISRPISRPGGFEGLTAAEVEVAEGILEGLSARELARRRGVSERTIANQTAKVYRKLRVNSRHELVSLVASARRKT